MRLNTIKPAAGSKTAARRVGRGIGSGPQHELPDELFERLGLTSDKAEDALDKVLQAEAALRELASQFNHPH